jgi:hypothetical protein
MIAYWYRCELAEAADGCSALSGAIAAHPHIHLKICAIQKNSLHFLRIDLLGVQVLTLNATERNGLHRHRSNHCSGTILTI